MPSLQIGGRRATGVVMSETIFALHQPRGARAAYDRWSRWRISPPRRKAERGYVRDLHTVPHFAIPVITAPAGARVGFFARKVHMRKCSFTWHTFCSHLKYVCTHDSTSSKSSRNKKKKNQKSFFFFSVFSFLTVALSYVALAKIILANFATCVIIPKWACT